METFSSCHPQLLETEGFSKDLECWAVLNAELGEPGWASSRSSPLGGIGFWLFSAFRTGGCDFQMTSSNWGKGLDRACESLEESSDRLSHPFPGNSWLVG